VAVRTAQSERADRAASDRAARAAALGLAGRCSAEDAAWLAQLATGDPDARVRATALGALVRAAPRSAAAPAWKIATGDPDPAVRRRAAETAPGLGRAAPVRALLRLLEDDDPWVADAAAFALGERPRSSGRVVDALVAVARGHADALVRESAVAALGALGDPRGLPAVLDACHDKPAIRRRAVVALAAFEGPEVEAALTAARSDRDWQVRDTAEILLGQRGAH